METTQVSFNQVVSRGCGIDVHQKVVVATISGESIKKETREYGTFTRSLTEMKEWLLEHGIAHVAMESTGVYWKPVYQGLDCECPSYQVCPGPQDGQAGQRVDLQVTVGRFAQAELYLTPGTAGVAGSDAVPDQADPACSIG